MPMNANRPITNARALLFSLFSGTGSGSGSGRRVTGFNLQLDASVRDEAERLVGQLLYCVVRQIELFEFLQVRPCRWYKSA